MIRYSKNDSYTHIYILLALGKPTLTVTGCTKPDPDDSTKYQCPAGADVTLTCEQGQAIGATGWEIKKKDSMDAVKTNNADKAITLKYKNGELGSGVYTCVAHKGMENAISDGIELEDKPVGKS